MFYHLSEINNKDDNLRHCIRYNIIIRTTQRCLLMPNWIHANVNKIINRYNEDVQNYFNILREKVVTMRSKNI